MNSRVCNLEPDPAAPRQGVLARGLALALVLGAAIAGAGEARAGLRQYAAPMHASHWRSDAEAGCALVHSIPLLGVARFQAATADALRFSLRTHDPVGRAAAASLSAESPAWEHDRGGYDISEVRLAEGRQPLALEHELTLHLLLVLEQGGEPTFRYPGLAGERVEVRLSPVRFVPALRRFRRCLRDLPGSSSASATTPAPGATPLPQTAAAHSAGTGPAAGSGPVEAVYFELDSAQIDADARQYLDRLAATIANGRPPREIHIIGHADGSGTRDHNLVLSEARALNVVDYLRERGVAERLMRIEALGDRDAPGNEPARAYRYVRVELRR